MTKHYILQQSYSRSGMRFIPYEKMSRVVVISPEDDAGICDPTHIPRFIIEARFDGVNYRSLRFVISSEGDITTKDCAYEGSQIIGVMISEEEKLYLLECVTYYILNSNKLRKPGR